MRERRHAGSVNVARVFRRVVGLGCLLSLACGGATTVDGGLDARLDDGSVEDGSLADAAGDGAPDAARDGGPPDGGQDADADIPDAEARDAGARDAGMDAGDPCPSYRIGEYMVAGDIPTSCPVGDGDALPRPIVSRAARCVLRIDWDPIFDDRLRLEGELRVEEDGALMGTLDINDVPLECVGRLLDDPPPDGEIELACGECSFRLRPRTDDF